MGYDVTKSNIREFNSCLETIGNISYKAKESNDKYPIEQGNLLSYIKLPNRQGFYYHLNENHIELLKKLDAGVPARYIDYPRKLRLMSRKLSREHRNIAEYLAERKGLKRHYPTKLKSILLKVARYKKEEVENEHPEYSRFYSNLWNTMIDCDVMVKFPDIIPSKEAQRNAMAEDYLEWKVRFKFT